MLFDIKTPLFSAVFCDVGMEREILCLFFILIICSCRGIRTVVITVRLEVTAEKTEMFGGLCE